MNDKARVFINSLLLHPIVQKLKLVDDKGITVSTHTYDVLRIVIKNIKKHYLGDLEESSENIDLFSILVGVLIHDTTKATLRLNNSKISHSMIMKRYPDKVQEEAERILKEVEDFTKLKLRKEVIEKISHIVVSHHGRWGKIKPEFFEAELVHEADKYSATYHRITPIGAKKIIKLMSEGFSKEEIIKITGYTEGIINDRLKRSKKELNFISNRELINYFLKKGYIPDGDESFTRRIRETEKLIKKVETIGFEEIVLKTPIIDYLYDEDIFY